MSVSNISRWSQRIVLMSMAAMLPLGLGLAQEVDELGQVESWLAQGVSSAFFTQEQADVMLEALRGHSAATEAFIRTQVSEGMNLAARAKAGVAETYLTRQVAAHNRVDARMTENATDSQGKYVSSIDIAVGEIIITYGNEAHSSLEGKVLILTPFATEDGSIVWQCGLSMYATGRNLTAIGANTGNHATSVSAQSLPGACKE